MNTRDVSDRNNQLSLLSMGPENNGSLYGQGQKQDSMLMVYPWGHEKLMQYIHPSLQHSLLKTWFRIKNDP